MNFVKFPFLSSSNLNSNIANNLVECEIKLRPLHTKMTDSADYYPMNSNRLKRNVYFFFLTTIGVFLISFGMQAQTIQNSPLSYIGMGELYTPEAATNSMMGGIGVSNSNGIYTNVLNPALLARNHYTVFEVGVHGESKALQDYRQKQQVYGGNYQSLNLTLPANLRWTMAFSIRPHSAVEYTTRSYRRLNVLGLDSLIYGYEGKGGITKLSFSNGVRIGKEFYIGLESSFLFGTVNRNVSTQNMSDGQYYKIQLENLNRYSDFTFKGGVAYRKDLKNDIFLNLGATMDLSSSMSATQLRRFAILDLSGINVINSDTLEKTTTIRQNLPVTQAYGLSIEKVAKWMVGIDYSQTDWTAVDNNLGRSGKLPKSSKISIGGEYTPDFTSVSNFIKRMTYRIGYSHTTTPYDYSGNGKYAVDQNLSAGVSVPLRNLSYVNIAYQVGRRGLLADNGLEEQYHRITVGLTLSDLWFVKQRIN